MSRNWEMQRLVARGDNRGSLIAVEHGMDVPFDIMRVYYIFDTLPDVARGFHAHRKLRQWATCVAGSCTMLLDDGDRQELVKLDEPSKGLLIGPMVWREMHDFAPGTVLLVLADQLYDERDYIREYAVFKDEITRRSV